VRIPFGDRIEWLDTSKQAEPFDFYGSANIDNSHESISAREGPEGYYLATEADFNTAKALFTDKDAEELVKGSRPGNGPDQFAHHTL